MDYMNNPTARDQLGCANTDRELWREQKDDYYAPSIHVTDQGGIGINVGGMVYVKPLREWHRLAAIQDAKQQGNEDTAILQQRLEQSRQASMNWQTQAVRLQHELDAARGVQPAAKEKNPPQDWRDDPEKVAAEADFTAQVPAAQQESAPATEQLARAFHDVYERLANDFAYETRKETRQFNPTTPNGRLMIATCAEILKYHLPATSPAQDKPVAASAQEARATSTPTTDFLARDGSSGDAVCVSWRDMARIETAFRTLIASVRHAHVDGDGLIRGCAVCTALANSERALDASSPSEQKSSLPAETLSAQEQKNQETGNV